MQFGTTLRMIFMPNYSKNEIITVHIPSLIAFLFAGDSCPDSLLIYSSLIGVKSNFTILLSLPVSILEMSIILGFIYAIINYPK